MRCPKLFNDKFHQLASKDFRLEMHDLPFEGLNLSLEDPASITKAWHFRFEKPNLTYRPIHQKFQMAKPPPTKPITEMHNYRLEMSNPPAPHHAPSTPRQYQSDRHDWNANFFDKRHCGRIAHQDSITGNRGGRWKSFAKEASPIGGSNRIPRITESEKWWDLSYFRGAGWLSSYFLWTSSIVNF